MKKALVVIDLQNGVSPLYQAEKVIAKVNEKITTFRKENLSVLFIRHTDMELAKGSFAWEFVPELLVNEDDIIISKTQGNAFYQTDLEKTLQKLDIDTLEICGAQTEYCIDATIKVAFYKGYKIQIDEGTFSTVDTEILSAKVINEFYAQIWKNLCEKSPLK